MLISSWLSAVRSRLRSGNQLMSRRRMVRPEVRNTENLEIRSLLTSLVGVRPNVGDFYVDGDVRNVAPQELTLQFSLGEAIDASTVSNSSIQIVRAGEDGVRATADDIPVTLGFVGIGNVNNEVVVRFGENLPDDKYRIIIKGTGNNALRNEDGENFNNGVDRTFLFELDLGAQIIAVNPQPVTVNSNGTVTQARNQIEVYFNNDDLNKVSAETVSYYQLIDTKGTVSNLDDKMQNPIRVAYDAAADKAVLTFASSLDTLPGFGPGTYRLRIGNPYEAPLASAPVTSVISSDPGDSFSTANKSLGTIGSAGTISRILSSGIDAKPLTLESLNLIFPGGPNDPGSREIERLIELAEQYHIGQHVNAGPDAVNGTSQIDYNFKSIYGTDPLGNQLRNVITEAQKERAREVFELFSYYLGIDFRETADSGLTIATGDMRALDSTVQTGRGGVFGLAVRERGLAIMDQAENWSDLAGGNWFQVAMHEIGHLIGLGDAYDQPAFTVMGSGENGSFPDPSLVEPDFPGDIDIVHGQYLHRPDSVDIDLYEFTLSDNDAKRFSRYQVSTEVVAERLRRSFDIDSAGNPEERGSLDSYLRIYKKGASGQYQLLAQNDDYFSDDSFLSLLLDEGTYYIGVSSTGNESYNPVISGTGFGGTSQGNYEVRLTVDPVFAEIADSVGVRREVITTITDTTGKKLDGDSDGEAGGNYDFWFQATTAANTLFVNKAFTGTGNGAAATPYRNVKDALTAAATLATGANTVVVRLVGNGGADGKLSTVADTRPYQIGFNSNGTALEDGSTFDVPRGTTVMIDGGAVLKLNRALISAGSSAAGVDRSGGSLQVLGTPGNSVMFTSWLDNTIGTNTANSTTPVDAGNWGGLVFRNSADRAQGRFAWQNEGIFLNYVAHADIRYGGGTVRVDSVNQTINPITIDGEQPTIVHNRISDSDDSAMAASPNSFEELTFHSPRFQVGTPAFTSSYGRVGPEIYGNTLVRNSTNGLFVQVITAPGALPRKMTVPGRFDDTDIVHIVAQNLEIQGTPGGRVLDSTPPSTAIVKVSGTTGGSLAAGTYAYRLVMTDENGLEGVASDETASVTVAKNGSVTLTQLPAATGAYTGRRLYRGVPGSSSFTLVAKLDRSATTYVDRGANLGRTLSTLVTLPGPIQVVVATPRDRARTNGSLVIDPGTIVKLEGARIEAEFGAQLIAEGSAGRPIIFTSRLDDRYGAGGTFDTNFDDHLATDASTATNEAVPAAGNWGGLYVGHTGTLSIDHALITFGGGIIPVGSNFGGFNTIEVHQADARITNSVFEKNGTGVGGTSTIDRSGLFPNREGTIFVRGAQPVILNNDFRENLSVSISINANALNSRLLMDPGRSTGNAEIQPSWSDNQGPLVRNNRFGGNAINGMQVRGETLTTQSVWDDTDIVHVLLNEVIVPNFEHFGGLRLESSSTASLVVKLRGANAGITAGGYALDIDDRIGGSLQIVGQPGYPVVLTSLTDDSVGAGLDLELQPLRDTDNDGIRDQNQVVVGDWRGISIRQFAHDRNVKVYVENELADANSPDTNGTVTAVFANSENIGLLAPDGHAGDENLRQGFEIHGAIDSPTDIDTYAFSATAGTGVWIDIDRASQSLDTVVELLDGDGGVVAVADGDGPVPDSPVIPGMTVRKLQYGAVQTQVQDATISKDLYTFSALDAGFRVLLPGTVGSQQTYFVRVRSRNATAVSARTVNGSTTGVYQLQIRKQETDEVPGSQITYGDVRYAATGISITGQPTHSPVVGESAESDNATGVSSVVVGNLMNSDRAALYLAGRLEAPTGGRENVSSYDVDFWEFQVVHDKAPTVGGVSVGNTHVPVTIDLDFADGFSRANVTAAVYDSAGRLILLGRDSNIADDQPRPLNGADVSDLTRGSNGKLDPFIGPVELLPGTYKLAIFPNDIAPQALDQYWELNPTSSLVRLEPINSVRRIAEERFADELFGSTRSTGSLPVMDLFTTTGGVLDSKHAAFNLGDVTLFVSTRGGTKGSDETTIRTVDALTGRVETTLGSFGPSIGDIAMRADGQLHAFTTNAAGDTPETDATVGNYVRINTGTAEITNLGDDGIVTNLATETVTPGATPADPPTVSFAVTAHDVGMQFNAMAYSGTQNSTLYAIGSRTTLTVPPAPSTATLEADYTRNILYNFSAQTGAVDGNGDDRPVDPPLGLAGTQGAGTTQREIGQVNTSVGLGGNVTGMAFLNGQFYVIDHLGGLYRVNPSNAATTYIGRVATPDPGDTFSGLTAGPDETEDGRYAQTLFGVTTNGKLYAFSTSAIAQRIFGNGGSSIQIASVSNVTGLAFSTLDYNLWQITQIRGGTDAVDDGHGIDVGTFDDSIFNPSVAQTGGFSLYFGNTKSGNTAGNQNTNLDTNEAVSADPANSTDHRNVNFPGGAHGTVISNTFSLDGYSAGDKPSLYFNYFLETENVDFLYDPVTLMRDSFRVFIADASGTWNLLVTNDSTHISDKSDEFDLGPFGSTTQNPRNQDFPDVVEAFDNTDTWRQARVDLSNYAGRSGLKLRFDFSTAGAMSPGSTLPGDQFGAFNAGFVDGDPARPGSLRGMNNDVEGVYVDDIIIGFAERGEMITNAPALAAGVTTPQFILNDDLYNPEYLFRGFYDTEHSGIAEGAYDVELRRATDLAETQEYAQPHQHLYRTIDTNDREVQGTSFTVSDGDRIANGATFDLSDGWNQLTFQFVDTATGNILADPGNVPILFDSNDGAVVNTAQFMGGLVVAAINSQTAQDVLRIQATYSGGIDSAPSSRIHLFGNAVLTLSAELQGAFSKTVYYQSVPPTLDRFGNPTRFDTLYTPELTGDQNRLRDQGQIIVQSTIVQNSLNYGVDVDSSVRRNALINGSQNVNNNPPLHPGAPKNTQENNDDRLTTGVVIANSLIVRNRNQSESGTAADVGGIRFRGDVGTSPLSTVPYGRLVNNTIVGAGGGTGILVADNASPTIVNNIIADFATGISVDPTSIALGTTIAATLYRGNTTPASAGALGQGTFPIVLSGTAPLFVDQSVGNYYPAPLSLAVDSALNSLGDRDTLIRVRNSLGLGISPIIAPDLDVYGQVRGDDEAVSTPASQGANVFLDRGAIDRVDFFAPIGRILVPEDQSAQDRDPAFNSVSAIQRDFRQIRIRLNDEGVGIDDRNIRSSQFTLLADGVPLVENGDDGGYRFSYNDVTNEVTFDAVTVFDFETLYEIRIDNDGVDGSGDSVTGVRDSAGNFLRDNQSDGTTRFYVTVAVGANNLPTIDAITNLRVQEDSGEQTVTLKGISAGGEIQPIAVTASSSNPGIIPHPVITYPSAVAGDGILKFTPVPNASGSATITVRVEDGGFDGDLATTGDNKVSTRTFVVTVTPLNDVPSLAAIGNLTIPEDAAQQTINLTGITAGPLESQPLRVTATSSNRTLIPTPTITYATPASTGSLRFTPAGNAFGTSTITVTVEDGGLDGNLSTVADNAKLVRTFVVRVTPVNDQPVANSGNYIVEEGYSFILDAGPSSDVDEATGDILRYAWDLNGDGDFETSTDTATTRVINWTQLTALGFTAPSTRNITLRVTDSAARTSLKTVTLTALTVDYGDAPDTYGTLKTSNGASHVIGSLFLGSSVDKELTGQPGAAATGDGSDENGVVFNTTLEVSPTVPVPSIMTVTASAAGKLDVWLDRNNNGVFDAAEHLNGGVSYNVVAGANRIQYILPAGTTTGNRMMRFRVSSAGRLQPTGRAANGEVEDYRVSVQALKAPVKPAVIKPVDFAPTDGNIAETTDRTPLIEWSLHPTNDSYSLELRNAAGATLFSRTGLKTTSFDTGTALASGLADGTYSVRLTAANRGGTASPVAIYSFKVVTLAVSAPTSNAPSPRPVIRWNPVPGTTSYFVEILSFPGGLGVQSGTSKSNSFTPTADLPLGQYQVRVRAADAAGLTGNFSSLQTFGVTRSTTVTSPVTSTNKLRPVISWAAVPGASSYEIQLDNKTDGVLNEFQVRGLTTTSWTPPSNLKLARYTVRVTAVTATGFRSIASPDASFLVIPPVAPVSPVPGGSSTLVRVPDSTPTFGWAAMPGADRYELIVRNKQRNNTAIVISQTQLTSNSFTQPADLPMGHYTYQVRAVNTPPASVTGQQSVFSEYSPEIEFVISTAPVLSLPLTVVSGGRPLFEWTVPKGAVSSDLEVRASGDTAVLIRASGIRGNTYQATKDLGIGSYVVIVRSNFSVDNPATPAVETEAGDWSLPRTFRVSTLPFTVAPTGRIPDSTPTLTWNAVPGAQTYELSISSDTVPVADLIRITGLNATSYTIPEAQKLPIGRYSWMVRAVNPQGVIGSFSTLKKFEVVTPPVFLNPISSTFDTTPTFTWNNMSTTLKGNPAGAGYYEFVLYDTDPDTGRYREFSRRSGLTSTSWTSPSALPAGNYRAVVRATSLGLPGANVAPTVSDNARMDFHVGGRTTVDPVGTTTDTTPTITWRPVQGATSYDLRITTGGTPDSDPVRQVSVTTATWTNPASQPLAKGTYRVWVRAVSGSTRGPWSYSVVMTIADVSPPSLQAVPAMAGPSQELPSEHRMNAAIVPAAGEFSFVSHTVSMLPAVVITETTADTTAVPAAVKVPESRDAEFKKSDSTESNSTDAVLAGWDQQLWWQSSETAAPAVGQDSSGTKVSTTASIFGAMLALTPHRLRNRISRNRRKEQ